MKEDHCRDLDVGGRILGRILKETGWGDMDWI
jgi:hypothetical protein